MKINDLTIEQQDYVEKVMLTNAEGISPENYKSEWKIINGECRVRIFDEARTTPFVHVGEHELTAIRRRSAE